MTDSDGLGQYLQLGGSHSWRTFEAKPAALRRLINEALRVLSDFGVPIVDTPRRMERTALAFLAVADVRPSHSWRDSQDMSHGRSITTRGIIAYEREHFGETISSGSYDDIRRRDLVLSVTAGVIVNTAPHSARNSPSRGYALAPEAAKVVRAFGTNGYAKLLTRYMSGHVSLAEKVAQVRDLATVPVVMPSGDELQLGPGEHNLLQKAIIESFLPRYGFGAEVLYVGDARRKLLHLEEGKLKALRFFTLDHGELPDVVAYSAARNWLYLIEAVHSANPISVLRLLKLKELTQDCAAELIYVSAFLDKASFRSFIADIAWETEVWIADSPDHLIHFDGEKFLGPYS